MAYEQVLLASGSPRRSQLLDQIGVRHQVRAPDVDESRAAGESPRDYVLRLAVEKARAVPAGMPVLAADTAVAVGDEIFGKPADRPDAIRMLAALSGITHDVLTAVALACEGRVQTALSSSRVRFRSISAAECSAYWDSGEAAGKAGAYAIQGRAAVFVAHLEGSFSGVMGLPLFETAALLDAAGVVRWGRADP